MLSLEEAQAAILKDVRPADERECLALVEACDRYLGEPLSARIDHPAFDNSAMDGYAINTADLAASGHTLPLGATSRCGDRPFAHAAGTATRIYTGAPLPMGADTVVIQEDVRLEGERVSVPRSVRPKQHLRLRGEDFRAGEVLYQPGRRLRPCDLAVIATAGISKVSVWRRPRALVIATGDELVPPGEPIEPGQVYDSNRLTLVQQLSAAGATVTDGGAVGDDAATLRAALGPAPTFDFVVTSGGASVGDFDVVREVYASLGDIKLWKARVKPGKPIAFGRLGDRTHFFALPGNPVSSLVTFMLFVEPALVAWHHGVHQTLSLSAIAQQGFRRRPGRTEFLRARIENRAGELYAYALPGQGSHMIGALREANAFIRLESESAGFEPGDRVAVLPLLD